MKSEFLALLSDFGERDPFVSTMKGVIYSKNKKITIIDITHNISPQNIKMGAFYLMVSMQYMPKNTTFLAVIDPDVGTGRGIIWTKTKNYQFITPDNGLISWIDEKEKIIETRFINNNSLFLNEISMTFHGRDMMAPASALIAKGFKEEEIGPIFNNYRKFPYPHPQRTGNKVIGDVISIDNFGNVITNITPEYININSIFTISGKIFQGLKPNYVSVENNAPLCVIGSYNFLEFSIRNGNFANFYNVKIGDKVEAIISLEK